MRRFKKFCFCTGAAFSSALASGKASEVLEIAWQNLTPTSFDPRIQLWCNCHGRRGCQRLCDCYRWWATWAWGYIRVQLTYGLSDLEIFGAWFKVSGLELLRLPVSGNWVWHCCRPGKRHSPASACLFSPLRPCGPLSSVCWCWCRPCCQYCRLLLRPCKCRRRQRGLR